MRINQSSVIKLMVFCVFISMCHAHYFCEQLENVPNCRCNQTSYESELYCLDDPDVVLKLDDEALHITCEVQQELRLEIFPKTSDIDAESLQLVNCSIAGNTTFKQILQHFDVKNTNSLSYEDGNMDDSSIRDRLSGLSHFENVNIIRSNITELHENIFDDIRKVTKMDLSSNKLKQLPVNVFSNLKNLEMLILSDNKLESLSAGTFRNQGKLEILWLSKNQLTNLEIGTFQGLSSLKQLDITQNKLVTLQDGAFDDITELTHLDLSENKLTSISGTIFQRLSRLEELKIDDNKLASIHTEAFVNNVNLQDVHLNKNRLSFRGVGVRNSPFRNLHELWSLSLDNNLITTVVSGWRKLKELSILSLKFNRIDSLNYEDLNFESKEVYMDLEENNLKSLLVPSNAEYKNTIDVHITKIDCCQSDLSRLSSSIFSIEGLHCTSPISMVGRNVTNIKPLSSICDIDECPSNCTCSRRQIDNTLMLDCSKANPQQVQRFSVSGNYSHIELHVGRHQASELPRWVDDLKVQIIRHEGR